jgi:hypothetical protein
LLEIATYERQESTAISFTSVEVMNPDIDEGMIASGETQLMDLGFELRLLPTPRTQPSETISSDYPLAIIFATTLQVRPLSWYVYS